MMLRAALAFALLGLTGPMAAADRKPIPLEAFADTPFIVSPVISPDGRHFAARTVIGTDSALSIFPLDSNAKPRTLALGKLDVLSISWAGNGRVLLQVSTTSTWFGIELPIIRLVAIDVASGAVSVLDQKSRGLFGGDVLYVDPDGMWLLVASQDDIFASPSVKRIDLPTGAVTRIEKARPGVWSWYADNDGVVRAGIAYSGDRWTLWYRAKAGDALTKTKGRNRADGEDGVVDGLRFLTEPGKGVILTNARTGRFAAYRYDFETAQIGAAIYEHPDVDISAVRVDPLTGDISGVAYTDDRDRIAWLDPKLAAIQQRIDKALPNAENFILNTSRDNNRLLVWSGAAHDPGGYYLYDRKARELRLFAKPFVALENVALAPVKPVRYAARDGLSIPGYLTLPAGGKDTGLPLIVMPHGGPYARDNWDYDPYVQFLASRGYAVLQPNFRGSTGYGKAFVERGYGEWGRKMQDDIDDGVAWLAKNGTVDPKRVCVFGTSYGGYAALWGATRNPDIYRCAISLAGVTDLPAMLKYDRKQFAATRYYKEWESKVRGAEKMDLAAVSPLAQAARLTVPVLIAHGDKDTNVPAKQSRQLVTALQKRQAAVETVFYPDEGHGLTKREDIVDFLKRLEAFLAKHNPA